MSDKIRVEVVQTLEGLLSAPEDSTRTTAAACLGATCNFLSADELALVLNLNLLGEGLLVLLLLLLYSFRRTIT